MKIWVDADACPVPVKDVIMTAAIRRKVKTIFVANKQTSLPTSEYLSFVQVALGPDVADDYIKEHTEKFDLIVTQDTLLAHQLVPIGAVVIDPYGRKFTEDNIGERVALRNLLQESRDRGEITGGPKPFGAKEKREFASVFDKELTRLLRIAK